MSWHVQNCDLIGSLESKLDQIESWLCKLFEKFVSGYLTPHPRPRASVHQAAKTSYDQISWNLKKSCEMGCWNCHVTLNFDWWLSSIAAETPVKFQSDWISPCFEISWDVAVRCLSCCLVNWGWDINNLQKINFVANFKSISLKKTFGSGHETGCLVTWFCYQLIAKPGNKTAAVSWPDPFEFRFKFHWFFSSRSNRQYQFRWWFGEKRSHCLSQWWLTYEDFGARSRYLRQG